MSRRVRVANCHHCGKLTQLDRKSPQPKHESPVPAITTCRNCYFVFENDQAESRLIDMEEWISSQG